MVKPAEIVRVLRSAGLKEKTSRQDKVCLMEVEVTS